MTSRNDPDMARLAALDAGLLDPQQAAAVRAAAAADPRATAVLDALAATRAELATQPRPALPPDVASRIAAALDEVDAGAGANQPQPAQPSGQRSPGTDAHEVQRPHRRSPRRWLAAAAAVLAVAAAAGVGALVTRSPGAGTATPVLALSARDLAAAGPAAAGTADLGALADPARRAGCLRAVGVRAPAGPVLGGRRVVLDGRPGVLLVLPTGILGSFRLVVVDPGCGPDAGTLFADQIVPR